MANLKLAQLEQLSQQLIFQVKTVNHLTASLVRGRADASNINVVISSV